MTDYSANARNNRAREMSDAPPDNVRRPWPQIVRAHIAALVALIPVLIEAARQLQITYGEALPWLAQFIVVLTLMSRVLNSHAFETWAARWTPWLLSRLPEDDLSGYAPRHARGSDD